MSNIGYVRMSVSYEVLNIYGYVLDVGRVSMRGRREDDVCKKEIYR